MEKKVIKILLIEDNPGDARLIEEMLVEEELSRWHHHKFDLDHVTKLKDGKDLLDKEKFDMILLDLRLPDSEGYDTFKRLHDPELNIPIVILSGVTDRELAIKAVREGAQDYLVKGQVNSYLFVNAIQYAIERKQAEEKIRYLAFHDNLTNLPNRRLFFDRFSCALSRAKRYRNLVALLYVDLDGFKDVNDEFGHEGGDAVLIEVANRLLSCLRDMDTVARIGGDEFAVIIQDLNMKEGAGIVAEKIINSLEPPFIIKEEECPLSASIGISLFPKDGYDMDTLLKRADSAMYVIKKNEKNNYCFFDLTFEKS